MEPAFLFYTWIVKTMNNFERHLVFCIWFFVTNDAMNEKYEDQKKSFHSLNWWNNLFQKIFQPIVSLLTLCAFTIIYLINDHFSPKWSVSSQRYNLGGPNLLAICKGEKMVKNHHTFLSRSNMSWIDGKIPSVKKGTMGINNFWNRIIN